MVKEKVKLLFTTKVLKEVILLVNYTKKVEYKELINLLDNLLRFKVERLLLLHQQ
jgi:hypothetical protein